MIDIILVEPETPGNIGAIARIMGNFGFKNLVLLNPCDHLCSEAIARSKHANQILENATVLKYSSLKDTLSSYDYVVGTTAILGSDFNIPRSPLTPSQLSDNLSGVTDSKIALVFGREGTGLSNEELSGCDYVVSIPSSISYPTLNLSHAASIILYELFAGSNESMSTDHITPISKAEKDQLLKMSESVLDELHFTTEDKRETQDLVWKRIVGKSNLTKRESYVLMGFFRKLLDHFKFK